MLAYSVALVGGVIITGQMAGRALFLSALPREAIPYKYMLPPLALMLATAVYAHVTATWRRDRVISGFCLVAAAGAVAFRVHLGGAGRGDLVTLCALFVFLEIVGSLAVLQFWTFASDIFDTREAKRLFGLIAGGSAVSNVLFGAVLSSLASRLDPADLLLVIAASLLVCVVVVRLIAGPCRADLPPDALQPPARPESGGGRPGLLDDLRVILAEPLVRTIAAVVILVALASGLADYVLDLTLQRYYGDDGQGMVAFLGRFRLIAGLLSMGLQFFLAARLLERFGVLGGLALLPATMALGSGAVLLAGGALWAAALPRACDVVLKYTVHNAAVNLLYLPIDPAVRARAKALLDGIVKPPLVGLLGLAFLFADRVAPLTPVEWGLPLLVVALLWLLLMRPAGRQYVEALTRSLRLRKLDLDAEPVDLTDDSSIRVVRESLRADDEGRVFHAMYLALQIPHVDFRADLEPLVHHPSAQIRRFALRQLAMAGGDVALQALREALRDEELDIRGVAVEELCVADAATPEEIDRFLTAPEPRLRAAAALGMLRQGGMPALALVGPTLRDLLEAEEADVRLEGVRAVRYLGEPQMAPFLIPRLADADLRVRDWAVRGAGGAPLLGERPVAAGGPRAGRGDGAGNARGAAAGGGGDRQPAGDGPAAGTAAAATGAPVAGRRAGLAGPAPSSAPGAARRAARGAP
jgi:AAA family ATP:ADP antiporter